MREDIASTPLIPRSAASTRCATCVSSSIGAAPGCDTMTSAPGKLTSGLLFTSMRMKLSSPASVNAMKRTIGGTGLRIAHDDMFRKSIHLLPTGCVTTLIQPQQVRRFRPTHF
jgi:hypothetical protein